MLKQIYQGQATGFYDKSTFFSHLSLVEESELLARDTLAPNEYSNGRISEVITFNLPKEGVVVRYESIATAKILSGKSLDLVTVILAGRDEESLSKVERIIKDSELESKQQKLPFAKL